MAKSTAYKLPAEAGMPRPRVTHVPLPGVPDVHAIIKAATSDGGRIALQRAPLPLELAAELFTAFAANVLTEEDKAAAVIRLGRPNPGWALSAAEVEDQTGVDANAVAQSMQAFGRFREAEQLVRQALTIEQGKHGRDSELSTALQLTLAGILAEADEGHEAKRLLVTLVERQREKLGNRHPETLETLERLGRLLVANGELAYAEPLLCEVVLVRRHTDGDEHPATWQAIAALSGLLLAQGKPSEAEPLLRRALRGQAAHFGEAAAPVMATRNLLAETLLAMGNVADAEALLAFGLRQAERAQGRASVAWLSQVSLLGAFLLDSGRPGESRVLLVDAYSEAERMLPAHSSLLAKVRGLLGRCQRLIGALSEAEKHLVAAYEAMRETLGLAHVATQKLLSEVIALYTGWGKPLLAAPYRAIHAKCS